MHNGMCTGSHFQAFPSFSRVLWCHGGKSETLGRGQIVYCTALHHKMAKTKKKRNGEQGIGMRKPRKSAGKTRCDAREGMIE